MLNFKVIRCVACRHLHAPAVYVCKFCHSEDLEDAEVPGKGTLFTYSTVYVPLSTLEEEAPYTVAIVELEGGCKVTGRLVKPSQEKLNIGAPMKLVQVRDGTYFFDFEINER